MYYLHIEHYFFLILAYPRSPQPVPHEFFIFIYEDPDPIAKNA